MKKYLVGAIAAACVGVISSSASAAPIYNNNFDVDTTASWTVNHHPTGDDASNFFFDYSTVGIPSAPNSGGSTRGMKLQANQSAGIFSGFSVSPTGFSVAPVGDYSVTFDWWGNFNGPFPVGGSGSTQMSTYGIGTSGTAVQWPGGAQDSAWFAATVDGNSASDWRAYSSAAATSYPDASTIYAAAGAGNRNHSHPYYSGLGSNAAPAAQVLLYPQQTGTTLVGSAGMEWHTVALDRIGNAITWKVDGLLIATIDASTVTLAGGNIFFGHTDTNAGSSTDPNDVNLLFSLIDNVVVDQVPEPSSLALIGAGSLLALRRRRST